MKFKLGDKVKFLNEKGEGIIAKILSTKIVSVSIEEGFDIPFPVNQLVLVSGGNLTETQKPEGSFDNFRQSISDHKNSYPEKKRTSSQKHLSQSHTKNSGVLEMEVDLHIEELVENWKNRGNAEIVQIQLNHFQKSLDKAIYSNMTKIIFIHGVGTGKLKNEIHQLLKTYKGIRFYDASYQRYGYGATEVVISNSAK